MLLSSRILRHSMMLLCAATATCAAQSSQSSNQFQSVPQVQPTGGRVASFVTGTFQNPPLGIDFLYLNAPAISGGVSSVTAGELLNIGGGGFTNLTENHIVFTNASNVVAAVGQFAGFGTVGYAFALTPSGGATTNLCIYAGTGAQPPNKNFPLGQGSSYDVGLSPSNYPPVAGTSGCTTFPTLATSTPAVFGYIAPIALKTGLAPQLLVEDSVNGIIYMLINDGRGGGGGHLPGISVANTITLPTRDGAGPMYTADLNGDGNTDLIVNNQTGYAATVYMGNGDGTFQAPVRYTFDHNVHSMLLHDMDGDGILDMLVEDSRGAIEIFKGSVNGVFAGVSEGGTQYISGNEPLLGYGGHLVAVDPNTLDILATTPIGLSSLAPSSRGSLQYHTLNYIYNIGPGRSSFALGDFFSTGSLDLAVDSPEGIAIAQGNPIGSGGFQDSYGFPSQAPALGVTLGRFRNLANNPKGYVDAVVGTSATQAILLMNLGGVGFFLPPGNKTNLSNAPGNIPAKLWSNILSGDFNGDGNLDIAYSLTGLPLPSGAGAGTGLYVQLGNGDGTFALPVAVTSAQVNAPVNNLFYGNSALGDFNGDGVADLANADASFGDTLLGQKGATLFGLGLNAPLPQNTPFNQVAAGYFRSGRGSQQDLVFQQGSSFTPYMNKQDGTGAHFTAMARVQGPAAPLYASTALLTDVDGDGKGDLLVVYFNGAANATGASVYIWYGNGDGTFATTPQILPLGRNYYLGAVADMNADGLPDLVLSDGSLVSILYNQGARSFGTLQSTGQYSSEQHFLAGQGINSISLVDVNGDGTPDIVAANGGLTNSNPVALGGETASSLALTPNPDVNTGGITVLLNHITTNPVTETVVASPEPSALQATFTLTATITPSANTVLPTGAVVFSIDGVAVGNASTVVPGSGSSTATYTVPAGNSYTAGPHTISADYLGDSANSPFIATNTHTIASGATTTTLYLCVGPSAACPSNGAVVAPAPPYPTSLSMYYGQSYNGVLSATANDGSSLDPTSVIDFNDNYLGVTTTLCTLAIGTGAGGQCLPPVGGPGTTSSGVNVFTGVYPGDATHTPSSSTPVTINVAPDTTTATLLGAPNLSPQGQPVTLTATVTGNFAAPTGPVVFSYGSTVLGTASLVPGSGLSSVATLTTSTLPVGTDVVTANYAATLNFNAASATFTETITASLVGGFTVTVTPTPVPVGVGYSTLLVVTVTPQNGFALGVNLSCANLTAEVSCFFDSPSIAPGGGTTNLVVGTTAPHTCGTSQPYFLGSNGSGSGLAPIALPALAGLALLFVPGKRRWLRSLIAVSVVAVATQMTGCATCTDLGTRPATYTFQVVGTATGSGTTQAQTVTLTVAI